MPSAEILLAVVVPLQQAIGRDRPSWRWDARVEPGDFTAPAPAAIPGLGTALLGLTAHAPLPR